MKSIRILIVFIVFSPNFANAQNKQQERKGEFYFSWGYNKEWYTRSNVKVNQPSLNNDYVLHRVKSHDNPGWTDRLFQKPISIPQYNYRFGYFFNRKKGLGVEINFDHTKHIIQNGQGIRLTGKLNGVQTDTYVQFSEANGFYYFLNNGANFLLFNLVKRWNWETSKIGNFRLDGIGKAGVGPLIPHVENSLFGKKNEDGFQLGGWNMGVEAGVKATFYKRVFLEFTNKLDYASYRNLKVYEGTAKQAFGTYELILSLGYTFPMGKRMSE